MPPSLSQIDSPQTPLLDSASAVLGLASLTLFIITGNSQFDGLGGMAIGLVMALLATILVLDVKDLLVGRGASPEIEQDITETALAIKGVQGVHQVRTQYVGSDKLLVMLKVDVGPHLEMAQVERLIEIIRAELKDKIPGLQHVEIELKTAHRHR